MLSGLRYAATSATGIFNPPASAFARRWLAEHGLVGQYDAINAVIAAAQEILIKTAPPVAHEGHGTDTAVLQGCPEGASFSQHSLRKSVGC
jgi:hypothetical protein